jgi:hypothetical protein
MAFDESLQLGDHHWAGSGLSDCRAHNPNAVRGTDCCTACKEHHEIDMGWLEPRATERRPGTPGVFIILADVSGSISRPNRRRIASEAAAIIARDPRARLIAFGSATLDITHDPSLLYGVTLWECFPGVDFDGPSGTPGKGTYIGRALAYAAQFAPERTAVLSDGGTADRRDMLRIAGSMTGSIDAYYCHPVRSEFDLEHHFISADKLWRLYSKDANKGVMQELAQRGGGRFSAYPSEQGIYLDTGIRDTQAMSQTRYFPKGGNVHIDGPAARTERVYEDIKIIRQRRITVEDAPDLYIDNSAPDDAHIQLAPSNVTYDSGPAIETHHKPRSLAMTLLLGPRREKHRGELKAAPSAPTLPAPSDQPLIVTSHFSKSKVAR